MGSARGAIFDMDGVLIDSYHAHFASWLAAAKERKLTFTERQFQPTFGRTSREIIGSLWGKGCLSDKQIAAMDHRKEQVFREMIAVQFPAMAGVGRLLRALAGAGWALAVGSSGPPENIDFVLERLGVRTLFASIVTGRDVTRGKPNPEVFLLAAQRLGLPPAHCVVIEDAPAGVEAAHRAGMAAVGLASTGRAPTSLAAADLVVSTLAELSPPCLRWLIEGRAACCR